MAEQLPQYAIKLDRFLIPMAKGFYSKRVLAIALDIARQDRTEITAFSVKDSKREITWSDKVRIVTDAYQAGKSVGVKVIPKIVTAPSVREAITKEAGSRNYDFVLIGTGKRSKYSPAIMGGVGEYVLKRSPIPVIAASVEEKTYPYERILVPVSEQLSTKSSVMLALNLKKITGAKLFLADLTSHDRKRKSSFKAFFDNIRTILEEYGHEITLVRTGTSQDLVADAIELIGEYDPDAVVLGVKPVDKEKVRLSSNLKAIAKAVTKDMILVKR